MVIFFKLPFRNTALGLFTRKFCGLLSSTRAGGCTAGKHLANFVPLVLLLEASKIGSSRTSADKLSESSVSRRWRSARLETLEKLGITDGMPGAWVIRFTFASGPRPVRMCNRLNTCALRRFNGRRVALHQTNKTGRRTVRTCHRRFAFALPHVAAVSLQKSPSGLTTCGRSEFCQRARLLDWRRRK